MKFYPEIFEKFAELREPRHQSYVEYTLKTMLGALYYKCIDGISSMREMTSKFNDETVVKNLYLFIGDEKKIYMPHGVT